MNTDEIVCALREMLPPKVDYAKLVCAEGFAHGQCYVWEDPEPYQISAAIDLIASLQAQLAASQRREQAAVEDIYKMADVGECDICKHYNHDKNTCAQPDVHYDECFEWRGPQQAGSGGTE